MKHFVLAVLLFFVGLGSGASALPVETSKPISTFAFGGCSFQRKAQEYWAKIGEYAPQLWVWNGDIIYADILGPAGRRGEYRFLKSRPKYKAFIEKTMVIGTWDDHDYGSNNIGKTFSEKASSRDSMLEFLDEPKDSKRWKQEGVYASYVFGPVGRRAKFVLLDGRWFRDQPGKNAEILGNQQWDWLETEVVRGDYDALFVVSGSQVIPTDTGADNWGQYPQERARLFKLLATVEKPTILLSGDRHLAEISKTEVGRGKVVYEFTSSGLTHATTSSTSHNAYRVGPLYPERNFGVVRIDWEASPVKFALDIHGIGGKLIHRQVVK